MDLIRLKMRSTFVLLSYLVVTLDARQNSKMYSCIRKFSISNSTIIKTTESLDSGARYLKSVSASSRDQCMSFCCEAQGCSVAVLQEKENGDCYLFDCGSSDYFRCSFSSHANHVTMVFHEEKDRFSSSGANLRSQPSTNHEQDLNSLKFSTSNDDYRLSVSKSTDYLQSMIRPSTSSSLSWTYYQKALNVECSKNQWLCKQSGECIAIYDRCDEIEQCRDGTDELNCDVVEEHLDETGVEKQRVANFHNHNRKPGRPTKNRQESMSNNVNLDQNSVGSEHRNHEKTHDGDERHESGLKSIFDKNSEPDKVYAKSNVEPSNVAAMSSSSDSSMKTNTSLAAVVLGLGIAILALLGLFLTCKFRKMRRRLKRRRNNAATSLKILDDETEGEFLITGPYL